MRRSLVVLVCTVLVSLPFVVAAKTHDAVSGVVDRIETKQKVVALTFDADMTPKMLAALKNGKVASWYNEAVIKELEQEKVPATLFLTGMWIETYPTTTKELSHNPLFELANHSYSHGAFIPHCVRLNPVKESADSSEIEKTDKLLGRYTATNTKLFRFPGLCEDNDDLKAAHYLGYTVIGGNIHGGDGFQQQASSTESHILKKVRPGSIVVLHMQGGVNAPKTAEILSVIIPKLRTEGYSLVKVSDLLRLKE